MPKNAKKCQKMPYSIKPSDYVTLTPAPVMKNNTCLEVRRVSDEIRLVKL